MSNTQLTSKDILMIYAYRVMFVFIIALLIALSSCFEAHAEHGKPAVTLGQISSIQSTVLSKNIPLSIHLPPNYDSTKHNYPVLYMLGSDYRARFAMLASALDYMGGSQIPAMLLVGIDLPEGNRVLLPSRANGDTKSPDSYLAFIEKELIPYVDNKYRTAPFRALFGASNSGFFSVYTLLNKPSLFNAYLASSPSLNHIPVKLQQKIKTGPLKTLSENKSLHIIYSDDDFDEITESIPEFSRMLTDHKPTNLTYKSQQVIN
ncbi:alpha/beta hydrolase [Thalassotalea euphylliae]|uniref:Alpha/beta hydrolase n=2 Tax=Thalassotalea euphylliae TaxID=1655234 RepID=A0A3E0U516_9GAMM|nr:alpha/beta hydrolase [Thalassotalea euphylliae]